MSLYQLTPLSNISSNDTLALQRQLDGAVINLTSSSLSSNGGNYFVNNIQSFSVNIPNGLAASCLGFQCNTLIFSEGQFLQSTVDSANIAKFLIRYNNTSSFYVGNNASLKGTLFNMYYVNTSGVIDTNPVSNVVVYDYILKINRTTLQRNNDDKDEASGACLFSFDINNGEIVTLVGYDTTNWSTLNANSYQYMDIDFYGNESTLPPMVFSVQTNTIPTNPLIPIIYTLSPYMVLYYQDLTNSTVSAKCCSVVNGYTPTALPCNETNTAACAIELCQDRYYLQQILVRELFILRHVQVIYRLIIV